MAPVAARFQVHLCSDSSAISSAGTSSGALAPPSCRQGWPCRREGPRRAPPVRGPPRRGGASLPRACGAPPLVRPVFLRGFRGPRAPCALDPLESSVQTGRMAGPGGAAKVTCSQEPVGPGNQARAAQRGAGTRPASWEWRGPPRASAPPPGSPHGQAPGQEVLSPSEAAASLASGPRRALRSRSRGLASGWFLQGRRGLDIRAGRAAWVGRRTLGWSEGRYPRRRKRQTRLHTPPSVWQRPRRR